MFAITSQCGQRKIIWHRVIIMYILFYINIYICNYKFIIILYNIMWFFIYYLCLWILFCELKLLSSCRVKVLENENEEWVRNNQCYITWSYDTHQKKFITGLRKTNNKRPSYSYKFGWFCSFFLFLFLFILNKGFYKVGTRDGRCWDTIYRKTGKKRGSKQLIYNFQSLQVYLNHQSFFFLAEDTCSLLKLAVVTPETRYTHPLRKSTPEWSSPART